MYQTIDLVGNCFSTLAVRSTISSQEMHHMPQTFRIYDNVLHPSLHQRGSRTAERNPPTHNFDVAHNHNYPSYNQGCGQSGSVRSAKLIGGVASNRGPSRFDRLLGTCKIIGLYRAVMKPTESLSVGAPFTRPRELQRVPDG
jgi:hypothetical protein